MSVLVVYVLLSILSRSTLSNPIELTDETWKSSVEGHWMLEFYAPWCPACQNFQSTWKDFARYAKQKNVQVGAINVDEFPSLSARFRIKALPTVFHVKDGVFRQYEGDRSMNTLKKFIDEEKWKQIEPVSWLISPNGILISFMSGLFDFAMLLKTGYTYLESEHKLSPWLIYTIFALGIGIVGVGLGFVFMGLSDFLIGIFSRRKEKEEIVEEEQDEETKENIESKPSEQDEENNVRQRRKNKKTENSS